MRVLAYKSGIEEQELERVRLKIMSGWEKKWGNILFDKREKMNKNNNKRIAFVQYHSMIELYCVGILLFLYKIQ